jgi:alkylated DNA repair dioxygenase AlkB
MHDLLSRGQAEALPLADADLLLWRQVELGCSYDRLLAQLIDETEWRQERITVYGKPYLQPRLSAWHGALSYSYSGIRLQPLPWTPTLQRLKQGVERLTQARFNSVLLNYYRDENDSMGMHSDDERELGRQPVIASLSLGETRDFILKHRFRKDLKTVKLPLDPGSLLLMRGETQANWRHGINKLRRPCGPRINLTFRRVIAEDAPKSRR